ncbi:Mut7-C RNAse domain-containing protein [Pontibacter pamirensis]|uniref:Mut7-C RNAse domain-containing protein n=1 Tax=Pontibacter pamirensis TaxID=2562824 RepID=UPI00138A204F|nr:Mut7-C RNAse domain-containing protein [Pontibacter pamirensis]
MGATATFEFLGSLNDFPALSGRDSKLLYRFTGTPAVKDAIEAIGVPHPEVNVIMLNGLPVDFSQPLQAGDKVAVYPADANREWPEGFSLQANHPAPDQFVLDVHLGKLARALRMLGFDTCYENDYSDKAIAHVAATEERVVLTRDVGLLKHKSIRWGYWLRSQHPDEQLAEVILHFNLKGKLHPFTRCLACNGSIAEVPKDSVIAQLPPKTKLYFNEFYQCESCKRVYWKGSHYERMQQFIQQQAQSLKSAE